MTKIRLLANDQRLVVVAEPKLASGNEKSVALQVDFSAEWKDYTKSAVFFTERDRTVYEVLLDDGKCSVPHEVLTYPGVMFVGVRGVIPDRVKTSTLVKYKVAKGAPVGDGTLVEPTADVYQQILARIDAGMLRGEKGADGQPGKDGKDGEPGKDGNPGADGKDGKPGEDGFSPVVAVADIEGGHRVTITDKDGEKTFDVMDGPTEDRVIELINEALGVVENGTY